MPRIPRVTDVTEAPPTRPALGCYPGVVVEPIDGRKPEPPHGDDHVHDQDEADAAAAAKGPSNAEVRAWARAQAPPIVVSDLGPVPKHVREAYAAAHES